MIYVCCSMLATVFMYNSGIDSIRKKARIYLEKFLEMSTMNEFIKKQCIKIFLNLSNKMAECFDLMEKAAINWARSSETKIYQTLLEGLRSKDPEVIIYFLKFSNLMIYRADNDEKKATFIARLET